MRKKDRQAAILQILEETYKGTKSALNYGSPFELLVAVILSAQCTDTRVNVITARLFPKYNSPKKMGELTQEQMETLIHDCGLYHAKAKNILATCHRLEEVYGGQVPRTMDELVTLPGAGRKTANVVMSVAFGMPAIAVDTHVFRVSNRTGLAPGKTPLAVELQLLRRVPEPYRVDSHHWLILHGRYICQARKPLCWQCAVARCCDFQPKTAAPR